MILSAQPDIVQAGVEVGQGGVVLLAVELHQLRTPRDTSPLGSEPASPLLQVISPQSVVNLSLILPSLAPRRLACYF